MKKPETPIDEKARLAALREYDILDTEAEQAFDDLTFLAAQICGTPVAATAFLDERRLWFKATQGSELSSIDRNMAFCSHAIHQRGVFEVHDLKIDPRFSDNPLVEPDNGLRFYAGAPLITPDGHAVGTLCVLDVVPRELSEQQRGALAALGRRVISELERRKAIRNFEATQRHLEQAQTLANMGSWAWDIATNNVTWSENQYRLYGVTPGTKITFELFLSHFSTVDQNEIRAVNEAALAGEGGFVIQNVCRRKDGVERTLINTGIVEYDANRMPIRMHGNSHDVTLDLQRDQGLREERQRFQTLFESLPIGVFTIDAKTRKVAHCNPCALEKLGLSPDQLSKICGFELVKGPGRTDSPAETTRETKQTISLADHVLSRADGSTLPVDLTCTPLLRHDEVSEILVSFVDLSARYRMEEQLNESRNLMRQIFNELPVGVFVKDLKNDLRYIAVNHVAGALIGMTPKQCVGKSDFEIFSAEEAAIHRTRDLATLQAGRSHFPELEVEHRDLGHVTLKVSYLVVPDAKGIPSILIGMSEDISAQKESEKLIHDQQARLLTSSKFSALGEMAGGLAHEINNPLAIIRGKAAMLKDAVAKGTADKERIEMELTKIENTVARIAKIISGLRLFSRNSDQDPLEVTSLQQIVNETLELCRERILHRDVIFNVETGPAADISCRSTQVSQILMNLLNNALDAVEGLPERWISLIVEREEDYISVKVTDSGTGIPPEIVQKIMLPFFTTKANGKGTGLGLSISKKLAEENGGTLSYEAEASNTQFCLRFPIAQPKIVGKAV